MCLSVPGRITALLADERSAPTGSPGARARVDVSGVQREIDVGLLGDDVRPGDWVLIHLGFALTKIDAEEAAATLATLTMLAEPSPADAG